MKKPIELALLILAFSKSFWLGLFFLGYLFYISEYYKKLTNQVKAWEAETEEKEEPIIDPKKTRGMPEQFYPYKGCIIEQFVGPNYQITKPSGEILNKIFFRKEDAEKEIDDVEPFLEITKPEKSKVHNIRFVK